MTYTIIGAIAPDFSLPNHDDTVVTLASIKGAPAVIYFYPKDDTPGCTTEAKDFTALGAAFAKAGARVFGVSRDSVASHCKFIEKHELSVTLLSDESGAMCEAYGVWVEKSMYGKKYMGIERATFLLDAEGKVAHIWSKVSVKDHAAEVLRAVEAL
jgi:thioredoxin-dependent peroxiredoxin